MSEPAYIVFAHGSSVESANQAVRDMTLRAAQSGAWKTYATAFLDGGRPLLPEAIGELAAIGVKEFVVIPYFLTLGLHLERDLPRLIADVRRSWPLVVIELARPLDGHAGLVEALLQRAKEVCKPA